MEGYLRKEVIVDFPGHLICAKEKVSRDSMAQESQLRARTP